METMVLASIEHQVAELASIEGFAPWGRFQGEVAENQRPDGGGGAGMSVSSGKCGVPFVFG
jgi:hypothetical protein